MSEAKAKPVSTLRYALRGAAVGLGLLALLVGWYQITGFLSHDARFTLPPGAPEISGARFASAAQVRRVFAADLGRSVYLAPIAERRDELMTLDWVRQASVSRVWPNRVLVNVSERVPVAFLPLGGSRTALIDDDGVILPAPAGEEFRLPLVYGIRARDPLPARRERIRRVARLLADLGDFAARVSDVNAAEPDNLRVTAEADGLPVVLLMGDRHYRSRFETFLKYYPRVRVSAPGATTLDLRIEDRITAVEDPR